MKLKKIVCATLSFVCMFFLGLSICVQSPANVKAESPTVTVAINQNANNVDWDATQKRFLLDVVDIATGTTASFTAWESITSVIGNGVTMNGTGANLNFFGSTGDGVSVIYPSGLEEGTVFSIAEGTVINGYVFPEFTVSLVNGKWVKEPTLTVAINQGANNVDWDATQKRLLLDVVDIATGTTASFTAWESITSVIGNGVTMNGTGANLNFFGSTGDGVSVIYPSGLENGAVFNIALGTEANGHVFPEFTVSLVNGKWVKEPTLTVEINQYANNADWDATQKRVLLNVVDKKTGTTASFTAWESITSVIGNGVTMNGTGANLNFFGGTGDGVSVIYPSGLEDGAVFNIALGTEANGHVFPEFTISLIDGKWVQTALGTPDVNFTGVHSDNNIVWGGSTRAVRLVFSENFTAKAYDGNDGGFDAPIIADVRYFTKINGQSLGDVSFLQVENENSITFLYDESLLAVPEGQDYTTFTIAAGAPFGGRYLSEVTLYLVDGKWCENKPVTENVTVTNIHNRYGSGQKILLFLSNSDYASANTDITAKIASSNVLDYVNVYTSETEYVTLREIYQGNAQAKIWGEANSVGFQVDANYHGTAIYAIEIKKGAKFPAVTNDYTTYVVSEDIAYYNIDYKSEDSSLNSWAVVWNRMHVVTLEGELATGESSVKLYATPNKAFTYPEAYSKAQEGDENTIYVYNWYLDGVLYNFNTPVTQDITLTADGTFTAYYSYEVIFDDGKTQSAVTVNDGALVVRPEDPTKEDTSNYKYVFNGWYNGETRWNFDTPVTENLTLTAKFDQLRKIVLSDLYSEGKSSEVIKKGEITIDKSGDNYKGYVGSNLYFDLSLELSYKQTVELATFDVKITNDTYSDGNTSPFYLSWHVYYQRPANTLYIEYHKYNANTGARETFATAVSDVALSANNIYQANFAYRVIDNATGLVELYSNIAGWENTVTFELGAEYLATASDCEYLVFATEGSVPEMDIIFADPGLTGSPYYDVTLNGGSSPVTDTTNQIQLPSLDNEIVEDGIAQVFVGWTTDLDTLPNLYPAGYKLQLTGDTQLYAVWIGFEMEEGASVRLVSNSSGIRFTTEIDSADYNKLGAYVLSLGTFVVPTEYLAHAEFVHSSFGEGYYVDVATDKWREQGEDVAVWSYSAALVNIKENQYARSLSARGYLEINFTNGVGYVYTPYNEDYHARSIYQVATKAYNDTEVDYTQNAMILKYVNSVADITISNEMGLIKTVTAVGDYSLESSLDGNTFTVTFTRDISAAMINGARIAVGSAKNVQIGQFLFSIKDVSFDGSTLTFTVDVASDIADKYSDGNTYFRSSDKDLDFFLNDYFTRHATGINENGEDQTVNSVVAGKSSEEFFWWEWFSTSYYIMDTNVQGFDRIEGLREKLSSVPIDDYGYVWQNTDKVRDAQSTLASAEHRMGWPFPTANEMVVIEAIRTSLWSSATTNYITKGYSTSWDFNGSDRTDWSSNVNATLDGAGLFKGTASGVEKVTFTSPTLPQTHTVKKYSGISSSNITVYDEPAIYTYYAPLLELDVRMSNADNVKDIVVYFKTNEGGSTEYSMSVNDYAFIKYDYSGKYEHMLFLPMYAHENWGDSETRYVTDIRIEIIPKDGYTLTGDFALSYVRPSLDTRHTNNNSIYISSLRQDYDYTGDLEFLEQNITRARKAMNFLMQFYDEERDLINSSYLVGHDSDKTGSDMAQRIAHSLGNGYWDISFMPEYDFHSNSYFYKAVADMAYLESVLAEKESAYANDEKKAEANVQTAGRQSNTTLGKGFAESDYSVLDLSATATNTLNAIRKTTSQNGFWDATKGRFVAGYGDANADGVSEWVDYGYLAWNLEAIYYGIATEEQADLIMQWVTGTRTVAGDTSTGDDIYFFELAPRATTYQGKSATDSSVYTGVWHGTNNGGTYGESQVQHGGAIMYTSYYDLMSRINVNGADNAYERLNAIKDWYMDVYAYYQTSGSTPDDFYWDYYENSQWDSNGDGNGEYWRIQNGIKGQAERDGFTGGIIGIDGEFLESFLPVSAIPYGFFGVESIGNGTLQIAPKLPKDLDYWTVENLTFGGCKYDVTIYDNAVQITSVDKDEANGLTLKVAFDAPTSEYTVYVNGFATTDYEVIDGQIVVELAFGNAIVEIR